MHISINIPSDPWSLGDFANREALIDFYTNAGCDGIELILCGEDFEGKITPDMVRGLHLIFYPEWIRLWEKDYKGLVKEFGSRKAWQEFYNAKTPEDLVEIYKHELAVAKKLGVEYVVFHIGDNPLDEYHTLQCRRTDEEVIDKSCELLNQVFAGEEYPFTLLLENLWPGGMKLHRPELTRRMLKGVNHSNTGIMLDTGHLIATNRTLRTEEEACEYIHSVLDAHGDLCKYIKGVHLHKSLQGEYLQSVLDKAPPLLEGDYYQRFGEVVVHLKQVDPHLPFTTPRIKELIERIAPEYLVHELSRKNKADWENNLKIQAKALQGL